MNHWLRIVLLLLLVWADTISGAVPRARDPRTNIVWFPEMPTNIYAVLRSAIESLEAPQPIRRTGFTDATRVPTNQPSLVARHLRTLESLRQMQWPKMEGLERVRYRRSRMSSNDTNSYETAWLINTNARALLLLNDEFRISQFFTNWFVDLQRLDFAEELDAVSKFLASTNATPEKSWPYGSLRYWHSQSQQYIPHLFRLAYAAASFDRTNDASQLFARALRRDLTGELFERMAINEAAKAYDETMTLFDSGAARSEVLAEWERFVRVFPQSPLSAQLTNYATTLRQQVADFGKVVASTVENPERLPPVERAEYYLARFPEIPRRASSGFYAEADSQLDAKVVQLGYEAIPALIEHLTDRRLTRQSTSSYGRPRIVLRVQDLALQCLEKITQVRFYTRSSATTFSEEAAELREKLTAEVRAWWNENGSKPPLQGQLAQLERMPLHQRLSALNRLSEEHPGELDSLALLRKWAAEAKEDDRWHFVEPMAKLGDLSLLPELRSRTQRGLTGLEEILLRYGSSEDYAVVRRSQWQGRSRYDFAPFAHGSSLLLYELDSERAGSEQKKIIGTPLLVDLLEHRQVRLISLAKGGQRIESQADNAMDYLTRITGFGGNYEKDAPIWTRFAAMDDWLDWWEKQGKAKFISEHPEVTPVLFEKEITPKTLVSSNLPTPVVVRSANRAAPVVYEMARADFMPLLSSGAVRGKAFGKTQFFRFKSPEAEQRWWTSATSGAARKTPSRPPAMRVAIATGAWPDSFGRVWTCWANGSAWPVVYKTNRWDPFPETELPFLSGSIDGFSRATTGLSGAMFFGDAENTIFLHDANGWARFPQRTGGVAERLDRMQASLPLPPLSNEPGSLPLVKDIAGTVWSLQPDLGIVVYSGGKTQSMRWPDQDGARYPRDRAITLAALGSGKAILVVNAANKAGTFSLRNGQITKLREFSLPAVTLRGQSNPLQDSRGWLWISGSMNSVALDADGNVVTNHSGQVVSAGKTIWFIEHPGTKKSMICRWSLAEPELRLSIPSLDNNAAVAPDGTIWLLVQPKHLLRVGVKKDALAIIEKWEVPSTSTDKLWCDDTGRVWRWTNSGYRPEIACYPMRKLAK